MRDVLRERLLAEASLHAQTHPADLGLALAEGMSTVRRRIIRAWVIAVVVSLALMAAFVAAVMMRSAPSPSPILQSITITAPSQRLHPDATVDLKASGTYSNGETKELGDGLSWNSDMPEVLAVSETGVATAATTGAAQITAAHSGVSGLLEFQVVDPDPGLSLVSLVIVPGSRTVPAGETTQLMAHGTFSDGSIGNRNEPAIWDSLNKGIATVDGNGLVTGVSQGAATITAKEGNLQATAAITVTGPGTPTDPPAGCVVNPATLRVKHTQTQPLTAFITASNGTRAPPTTVTWSSKDSKIASVNTSGSVTGTGHGSTTIIALCVDANGKEWQATASVTIEPVATAIAVSPAGPHGLTIGQQRQLTATVKFSDGTTSTTAPVAWRAIPPLAARVDASGLVTGLRNGQASVTASLDNAISKPVSFAIGDTVATQQPQAQ
ncbi:Ig-like domain-containing protein [Paenarthrobacter sp. YAF11_1]|uniref:Ig-like domain-containing protein n=1 Tax=Paenarthrobacter sp. YAF11_1 TaxID=3233074 RepID=UPI003F9978B0